MDSINQGVIGIGWVEVLIRIIGCVVDGDSAEWHRDLLLEMSARKKSSLKTLTDWKLFL